MSDSDKSHDGMVEVFTRYITVKGKRIYRPNGGVFHFWVSATKADKAKPAA